MCIRDSFCAYVFGQLLDVLVFNRLRQLKTWWIAPSSSMTVSYTHLDVYKRQHSPHACLLIELKIRLPNSPGYS